MQQIANWTNLSETTFVVAPTEPAADYQVRIFTTDVELPFAGHPTIGTCHAWLEAGGVPQTQGHVMQQCGAGLVPLRIDPDSQRLAFAAPPLTRSGPVDDDDLERACRVLRIDTSEVVDAQWADNGPGWLAVLLSDAEAVLALEPDFMAEPAYGIGIVGPHPVGVVGAHGARVESADAATEVALEVRAFFRSGGQPAEDPVTGSLNAAVAPWLMDRGVVASSYVAAQGTAIGRAGRVYVSREADDVWVGGDAVTVVEGSVTT
jgi:PhzF family phenazine biosynthesis protein